MDISKEGIDFIKAWEKLSLLAYKDAVGVLTIGYGHAILPGETFALPFTEQDAEELLARDLKRFVEAVNTFVKVSLSQHELDALVSFAFNVGVGAFRKSTLLKKLNAGDHTGAAPEFNKWIYGDGRILPGLVSRRRAERRIFLTGIYDASH